MPRPYNYAQLYHRADNVRAIAESLNVDAADTRPIGTVISFEAYCQALAVDPSEARRASLLSSLAARLADDPIARALRGEF